MKRMIFLCFVVTFILLSLNVFGISCNLNIQVLNEQSITENRNWAVIDLTQYAFWNPSICCIYLESIIKLDAIRYGQSFVLHVRPRNDDSNKRVHAINAAESLLGDIFTQYVWLSSPSNGKIEYRLICTEGWNGASADCILTVRGTEHRDSVADDADAINAVE